MADPRLRNVPTSSRPTTANLFYPSEDELICHYLASKNSDCPPFGIDVIKEIDLYMYNPFDLPEIACFRFGKEGRRKHWYCFVRRVDVDPRTAANGYWKRIDGVKNVIGGGASRVVVGTRKEFVFYLFDGNSTAARKTEWVMHEYEMIGLHKASFVLCRVFVKTSRWEYESTPCYESSVVTQHHVGDQQENAARAHQFGLQHDGADTGKANEDTAVDNMDDLYNILFGQASELEDQSVGAPVAQQMNTLEDAATIDRFYTEQLADIFKDDFLELDDLKCPPRFD